MWVLVIPLAIGIAIGKYIMKVNAEYIENRTPSEIEESERFAQQEYEYYQSCEGAALSETIDRICNGDR